MYLNINPWFSHLGKITYFRLICAFGTQSIVIIWFWSSNFRLRQLSPRKSNLLQSGPIVTIYVVQILTLRVYVTHVIIIWHWVKPPWHDIYVLPEIFLYKSVIHVMQHVLFKIYDMCGCLSCHQYQDDITQYKISLMCVTQTSDIRIWTTYIVAKQSHVCYADSWY